MPHSDSLSIADKLLLAAYEVVAEDERPLTAEDIAVAAWRRFPRAFGLRGHNDKNGLPMYPDSNRVYAELMGSKPIRRRGHLKKVGTKLYALTASGRSFAQQLSVPDDGESADGGQSAGGKATMSREIRGRLERLLRSRAVLRAQNGELERVTFHDACVFWGITAHSKPIELEGAMANVASVIAIVEASIQSGANELRTGEGDLSPSTPRLLRTVDDYLQNRFADEMATIRRRDQS